MTTTTKTKKLTVATVKAFIRKHRDNGLMIETRSKFDAMQDMVDRCEGGLYPARRATFWDHDTRQDVLVPEDSKNSLGIVGVWFVGGRDYCTRYETETMQGFEVSNCCGCWRVAIKK